MQTFFVLFETGGNQQFIFSTNKLTDNVGASQLIEESGSVVVLNAVERAVGRTLSGATRSATRLMLRDRAANPPIEREGTGIEVIFATSGTALLVAAGETLARAIIGDVTAELLWRAPGLEMTGAMAPVDLSDPNTGGALASAHKVLAAAKSARAQAVRRFPRCPFVAPCQHSGLPAADMAFIGMERVRVSKASQVKRKAAGRWRDRIRQVLANDARLADIEIPTDPDKLDRLFDDLDWTAVVHADGNGVGSIFRNFEDVSQAANSRDFIDRLRAFSLTLEEVTERALCEAFGTLRDYRDPTKLRAVPLVLGGDDFTILCDGRRALAFAEKYLETFARQSADLCNEDIEWDYATSGGLHACAGVAITKPHFPFSSAYELAEALTSSAKALVKQGGATSALDFHILFDSTYTGLGQIRQRLQGHGVTLTRKPYAVAMAPGTSTHWLLSNLRDRATAIREGTGEDADLPSSQLHDLREGLFHGKAVADGRLANIFGRYKDKGLSQLIEAFEPTVSLFGQDNHSAYLDALESAPFWT